MSKEAVSNFSDDILDLYLEDMASGSALLTPRQEMVLATQIALGRTALTALSNSDNTFDEARRVRLQTQVEAGQVAREKLAQANTRLVVSIAKRYRGYGLPFPDLIQEGNVGLMRAVDRYKPNTECRFGSYAVWWIRSCISRALSNQGNAIRIPVNKGHELREIIKTIDQMINRLGRPPTIAEIAAEINKDPEEIKQLMVLQDIQPLSFEHPAKNEGDTLFGDFIEDESAPLPEVEAERQSLNELIQDILAQIDPKAARIIHLRFGLYGNEEHTLTEIAHKLGLSKERIRQIQNQALALIKRLLTPEEFEMLRDSLG